jgi:ankyrin repeat protein
MAMFDSDVKVREQICRLILQYDADPNIKNKDGWSPIHLAVKKN